MNAKRWLRLKEFCFASIGHHDCRSTQARQQAARAASGVLSTGKELRFAVQDTVTSGQDESDEGWTSWQKPKARDGTLAELNKHLSDKSKKDLAQAEHIVRLETAGLPVALSTAEAL